MRFCHLMTYVALMQVKEVVMLGKCNHKLQLTHDHSKNAGKTRTKREAMEAARKVIAERRDIIEWAEEQVGVDISLF